MKQAETKPLKGTPRLQPVKDVSYLALRDPPNIQLNVDPMQGGTVADGDKFTLTGNVTSPKGILDMYVLVNDQKVFYQAVDPKQGEPGKLKFSADFPLKEGNNTVMVVARESQDFAARKTVVIRRRSAALAQQIQGTKDTAKQ